MLIVSWKHTLLEDLEHNKYTEDTKIVLTQVECFIKNHELKII